MDSRSLNHSPTAKRRTAQHSAAADESGGIGIGGDSGGDGGRRRKGKVEIVEKGQRQGWNDVLDFGKN